MGTGITRDLDKTDSDSVDLGGAHDSVHALVGKPRFGIISSLTLLPTCVLLWQPPFTWTLEGAEKLTMSAD